MSAGAPHQRKDLAANRCAIIDAYLVVLFVVVLAVMMTVPSVLAQDSSPFCADKDCAGTRQLLKDLCDFIVVQKANYPVIFIGGYYMRTLVAGYEIFGDQKYLHTATVYADRLVARQMPNGFWRTGYGPVYMADTGSALGLLVALYPHVDGARQKEYFNSIKRYVTSIQADGMIHPWGAFGTGWESVRGDTLQDPIYDQYTLSSALTGGQIFMWMFHVTGRDEYREIAHHALRWVLSTMRPDGDIPYILKLEGFDWTRRNDIQMAATLWNKQPYGTSAYVGEGIMAFGLYCGNSSWKRWIQQAVKPNIEFLLRSQLADGSWSNSGQKSWDRTRSPGIINYLIWYYEQVDRDPRIVRAVRRFDEYVLKRENGRQYGLLNDGAITGPKDINYAFNTVTSLTGRSLADIVSPGVSTRW